MKVQRERWNERESCREKAEERERDGEKERVWGELRRKEGDR